jgi:hypothetical protein
MSNEKKKESPDGFTQQPSQRFAFLHTQSRIQTKALTAMPEHTWAREQQTQPM